MKLLSFALLGLLVGPLAAQNRIHVDISASAGGDGTSWGTAFTSLQDGLTAAALSVGDDEIWVAAGTYTPDPGGTDKNRKFQLASGVAIYGGFSGSELALGGRDTNPVTNGTVLSGDLLGNDGANFTNRADNSSRVIESTGSDNTAILDGFTVRGGFAATYPANTGAGLGGTGSSRITNCLFTDNDSSFAGGAIAIGAVGVSSSPEFSSCSFIANRASTYGGAADLNSSDAKFTNCLFEANQSEFYGGAVHNYYSPSRFLSCVFQGNQATQNGGGIYLYNGTPSLINCLITGNQANSYGGGIYCYADAAPVFTNTTIQGNSASTGGGGLAIGFNAVPFLTNCIIWGNSAAGSLTGLSTSLSVLSGTPTFSHSIVQYSGGSSTWDPSAGSDGGSNIDENPDFETPLDPLVAPSIGGDFALSSGSPAIDAGLDSADLDGAGSGTDTIASIPEDLAGNARFEGTTVDIGAYEFSVGGGLTSFATLFPALSVGGDDNQNGRSNFLDYALGADPTAPDEPAITPSISGSQVTFTYRGGTSDVTPVYKKSSTLSGWTTMQPGVDYNVISSSTVGDRIIVTLGLITTPGLNPRLFFVQEFPEP